MFPWKIAKSAEAMFSRWATKRVCKFFLKKKFGEFILGDIDLDQLDVQLTQGTIQLRDLALDVDYINNEFSKAASLMVKEGSIGCLLVNMPWSGKGSQVEVDGLELVISPSTDKIPMGDETCVTGSNDTEHLVYGSSRTGQDVTDDALKSSLMDVHEGVKTIANIVKGLLTCFHVKMENVIFAYDPSLDNGDKKTECHGTLVLRISEIECGTCLSEDADSNADVLGISRLTNFVRFKGAMFELLKIDEDDNCASSLCELGAGCGEPVMTGKKEGFGGEVKLSIPWKSGSLDIRKVDAVVSVDPIVLRFQLSTIKWFLCAWENYANLEKNGQVCSNHKSRGSAQLKSTLVCHSSNSVSVGSADYHNFLDDSSNLTLLEPHTEPWVPESRLISNWVPFSADVNQKDGIRELDFGASVDQFFECLDGIRSYQSALGNSGMWNWTCSVFSAITAASTLASGSLHTTSEQQHVETNLRATFAGISVVLSFSDDQQHCYGLHTDNVVADCNEILLSLKVCPQVTIVEGMMKNMEVAAFLNSGIDAVDSGLQGYNNTKNQSALFQHLQAEVLGALPSSVSCDLGPDSDSLLGLAAMDFPLGNSDSLLKVTLFKTSGVTNCKFTLQASSDGSLTGPVSFSLSLPPFTFWVIFSVISVFTNLLRDVEQSVEVPNKANKDMYKASDKKEGSDSCVTLLSTPERLHGDISISGARVILCFPLERGEDHERFFSWKQFIALDFTSPSPSKKSFTSDCIPPSNASSKRWFPSADAKSLQLSFSDLCMYLITSTSNDCSRISSCNLQDEKFSASRLLSVDSQPGCYSVINVVWQEGLVTGPWMTKKARLLANSDQFRSRDDFVGRGYEFASASTVRDLEELKSQTQQEMILSSSFFIHVHLPQLMIYLSDSQYKDIHRLVHQMLNELECVASQSVTDEKDSFSSQSSVFVECDSLEIVISMETSESIRSSLQSELPGSWDRLKLKVQNFDLLSVTNTGSVRGAEFFRLTHGEGKLWGSITRASDHDFLLITSDNSAMKRGNGGGSNPLSSRHAGSDIIHLSDPEISHVSTSITVACSTVVAVGGRLDWFSAISSFFSFPSSDSNEAGDNTVPDEDVKGCCRTDFVLNLIDIALCYEPYVMNPVVHSEVKDSESDFSYSNEDMGDQHASCLLAASLLTLSTTSLGDSVENCYQIRVQDLGLHVVSGTNTLCGTYSVEHLQKVGFIKVAQEAIMEANFKTNCASGILWAVELSNSHMLVETCHDTTASLIRLGTQLQQLFAPDVEESIVHLQNRWDIVQQAKMRNLDCETNNPSCDTLATASQQCPSKAFLEDGSRMAGLMDEICHDAFQVNNNSTLQPCSSETGIYLPLDGIFIDDMNQMSMDEPEVLSHKGFLSESMPVMGAEGNHALFSQEGFFPEVIEEYFLSDLCPLPEISMDIHSEGLHRYKKSNVEGRDIERGSGGWYQGNSLKVVENHISEKNEQTELKHSADGLLLSDDNSLRNKACGRVILKKIDLEWTIYGGSDWPMENGQHSGRDTTVCLELALSGVKFQYDIFPVGGVSLSKMSVSVQDFKLHDRSSNAPWKLVLGYYDSKGHPRESSSKAFRLDLEAVRPDPLTPLEEYRLHLAFLPIKLHLHQSQLDFLVGFFGGKSSSPDQSPDHHQDVEDSHILLERRKNLVYNSIAREALLPYFQKLDVGPILVRVDYSPHHVDLAALRCGKYVELVNLVPWKGVELNLKHVDAAGIYGWGSVRETIVGEWLEDISHNQIHKILRGLPAVRSLIAVGDGAAKLVSSPLENYKKERRVLKGMQRGTIAFLRSISVEAVGLGVHLAAGAHDILLQAEYILATSVASPLTDIRSNQPHDARHGIKQAYESLSDGLGKSAAVLVQSPLKKYQRGSGAGPALAAAIRAVPAAAIAPASACASAVHYALLGIRNSLDPERKKESMEKYCPSQPWEED
ncbi:autophagy-related protein 2-like [Prosopis cineraria]|uniref:autophagy-related protein 2-like n=1 Tax=Prosopis cineraria TaxID=364024 RepID=UPI00240EA5A4|nr:autophagy-related protein 2-like [Prosopis cineraria]XP_054777005.1 autophagy-related protein 2-like [Prosopis cineraria]XP_054777006.1 autophagy-related protein 2-like [Prosopis cineraria]